MTPSPVPKKSRQKPYSVNTVWVKKADDNPYTRFGIIYGVPEVLEARQNLSGARGFAFPEYEPMALNGDPIHPKTNLICSNLYLTDHLFLQT